MQLIWSQRKGLNYDTKGLIPFFAGTGLGLSEKAKKDSSEVLRCYASWQVSRDIGIILHTKQSGTQGERMTSNEREVHEHVTIGTEKFNNNQRCQ
ncbi:hypothetical protein RCL_jg18134.t1 [Rhizophagus clarus]|uniref:Uncharacterized protein n=1 Tax=Rhizophagus clarus TaxID=94130 RepID=A0A8H3QN90_9GLOM|nr:hypothetical protein RCL_jg18134.t1 [Rhizophagus clarus]